MRPTAKLLMTLALAGACVVLALPSMASAARSGVSIHLFIDDALKGFVFSPKPRECAEGRTVRIFRQKGKKETRSETSRWPRPKPPGGPTANTGGRWA
jgi:hypothetical protein